MSSAFLLHAVADEPSNPINAVSAVSCSVLMRKRFGVSNYITDRGVLLNHENLHDIMGALNNLNVDRTDFHYATPVCCVMHAAGDVMYAN